MGLIFKTQFGSQVYGTSVPTSDTDYKSIYIPTYKDLILQRAKRSDNHSTKVDKTARNTKDDIDNDCMSLQEYCRLLANGNTPALDMLFTPYEFWQTIESDGYRVYPDIWNELVKNKDKFLNKNTASFVGYTKQQAAKYGIKGFRVSAVESTLNFLKQQPNQHERLTSISPQLYKQLYTRPQKVLVPYNEHAKIVTILDASGTEMPHLEVCNRKVPFHATIKYTVALLQRIYDEYGARAQLAKDNQGVDWKALGHAVRVAKEAEELLLTGTITFPRPEKDLLLKIRKGELDYETVVAPLIEEGLYKIEQAKLKSTLPEQADLEWIDNWVFLKYTQYHESSIFS